MGKIPWRRAWQPTPIFLPGEFHGQRSLAGSSRLGCKELDVTERLSLHFFMRISGRGNKTMTKQVNSPAAFWPQLLKYYQHKRQQALKSSWKNLLIPVSFASQT